MARAGTLIRASYVFHNSVDAELKLHSERTGIPVAEIIRRAYDLYLTMENLFDGEIPQDYVLDPKITHDDQGNLLQPPQAYSDVGKRITFYLDPYLAYRLEAWKGQEAELLGFAVLTYIGTWAAVNPDDARNNVSYVSEQEMEPVGATNGHGGREPGPDDADQPERDPAEDLEEGEEVELPEEDTGTEQVPEEQDPSQQPQP